MLTAHPTEAKRRAVVEHLWRIGDTLDALDDPRCAGRVRADLQRRLAEDVASLWLTDPVRLHAPTPLDEVRATMALFDRTIFTTLPPAALLGRAGRPRPVGHVGRRRSRREPPRHRRRHRRGRADRARPRAARVRDRVAPHRAGALGERGRRPASTALRRSLARDARAFPARAAELARTLPDAPHRRKLVLVAERLAAARGGPRRRLRGARRVPARHRAAPGVAPRGWGVGPGRRRARAPRVAGRRVRVPPRLGRGPTARGGPAACRRRAGRGGGCHVPHDRRPAPRPRRGRPARGSS